MDIMEWFRALFARPVPEESPVRPAMQISYEALAASTLTPLEPPSPMDRSVSDIYAAYRYPQELAPAGMAMDEAPGAASMAAWAVSTGLFHEGQGFFGYPYLAELQQRAEYRHACEIWAEHVIRKWIKLTGGPDAEREAIWQEMDRLDVRTAIQTWVYHDHAYGRGQIFLNFGDETDDAELLTPLRIKSEKIGKSRPLVKLVTVEPVWAAPGTYSTSNPLNGGFYKPSVWYVYGRRVASSRMLTLVSRPVSDMLKSAYAFGGLSLTQMMKPYVDNWLRSRQAASDMLNSYSILNLKTDMSSLMGGGNGADIHRRVDFANNTRDNRGTWVTDKNEEELVNIAVPLSGVPDLQAQSQEQLASVARIPLSIYLQITPTGLNASNDGETRNFYADVLAYAEKNVRPALTQIIDIVQLSIANKINPDIKFEFIPLWEMSDADKAAIRKSDADADASYVREGIVSQEEVRERLTIDETSLFHGVDLTDAPPELPGFEELEADPTEKPGD